MSPAEQSLNVEALRLSQAALSESQGRYRQLVEHLPIVTYIANGLDESMRERGIPLAYISPQIEVMCGFETESWLEQGFGESLIHAEDRERVLAEFAPAFDGESCGSEYRLLDAAGDVRWIRNELQPVWDETGITHFQGYLFDVTDRVRAESERDAMEQELRLAQKLEAVGQLGAGIAHEINTPVQFIGDSVRFLQGALEDVLELAGHYQAVVAAATDAVDAGLVEKVRDAEDYADLDYVADRGPKAVERALDGLERIAGIVAAMKDFSEAPTSDVAAFDLSEAVRSTLVVGSHEYKYVADVETELADLQPYTGNRGQLQQVILHLLVNAAHAIADHGPERGRIDVRLRADGDAVLLEVADTGCGMTDEVRERIFDPFFTTKAVGRGTGQGMALVHRAVTVDHGGTIAIRTAPGAGTTVTVRLPPR